MDKLIKALEAKGIEIRFVESLCEQLRAMGYDPERLTKPEIDRIVADMVAAHDNDGGLTVAPPSVPGSPQSGNVRRGGRQSKPPVDPSIAIAHLASQSRANIEAAKTPVVEMIDEWTTAEAESLFFAIQDAPEVMLEKFGGMALAHKADAATFRQRGEAYASAIRDALVSPEAE